MNPLNVTAFGRIKWYLGGRGRPLCPRLSFGDREVRVDRAAGAVEEKTLSVESLYCQYSSDLTACPVAVVRQLLAGTPCCDWAAGGVAHRQVAAGAKRYCSEAYIKACWRSK